MGEGGVVTWHHKPNRQEELYEEAMGEEALAREQRLGYLAGLCTCGVWTELHLGPHHDPECPNWRESS